MKGGYGRGDSGIPDFGRAAPEGSAGNHLLAVFCPGLLGQDTEGSPAYGFVIASRVEPTGRSSKPLEPQRAARSGGDAYDGSTEGFEGEIVRSRAALLGDGSDGDPSRGPYRANGGYFVDATLGLSGCRDFERHNGRKHKKSGVPLVGVRRKHRIAAEEAEWRDDRHDPAPSRSASTTPLVSGARSKAHGGASRGGHKP